MNAPQSPNSTKVEQVKLLIDGQFESIVCRNHIYTNAGAGGSVGLATTTGAVRISSSVPKPSSARQS